MTKPIYANDEHKVIIEIYMTMCLEFAKEVSTNSGYQNYLEVIETILEYHNNYGNGNKEDQFWEWLMIIPINFSVATNGFFAGIETKGNSATIRAYRVVLEEMVQDTVDKIDKIQPIND